MADWSYRPAQVALAVSDPPRMAADLRELDAWIDEDEWPEMLYPVCRQGTLNAEKIKTVESRVSQLAQADEDWDPWIEGGFHGNLRCQLSRAPQLSWHDGLPKGQR